MTTNRQVAHIWAQGNAGRAEGSNFSCASNALYSYGTCVGIIIDGVRFLSSDNMTPTTAKQLSYAKSACSYRYFASPAFEYGVYSSPTPAQLIVSAAESHAEVFKALLRKRTNLETAAEQYTERRQEIIETARRFNVDIPEIPEVAGDLKAKAKELAAQERERREMVRKAEEERERAQRIIDQGQLDAWLQRGTGAFPRSFQERGNDRITIKDGVVVTSQGAEAPLAHVKKALDFYFARRQGQPTDAPTAQTWKPYHTNGHKIPLGHFVLDEIDEQGNVKAGCHRFTAREIERFIAQWREVLA